MIFQKETKYQRFSDLLGQGVGRIHDVADGVQTRVAKDGKVLSKKLRKDGKVLSKKAQKSYSDSLDALSCAESAMMKTVRENPGAVAGILLVLVGLVIGAMIVRHRRQAEVEEEW